MDWTINGNIFDPGYENLADFVGFVYLITHRRTGLKYIGKKTFHKKVTRPPLKGKTKKRRSTVESDWKTYCGSSEIVKKLLVEEGLDSFDREILHLCKTKGELNYLEMFEQVQRGVLFKPEEYLNGIIQVRINRSHVLNKMSQPK